MFIIIEYIVIQNTATHTLQNYKSFIKIKLIETGSKLFVLHRMLCS